MCPQMQGRLCAKFWFRTRNGAAHSGYFRLREVSRLGVILLSAPYRARAPLLSAWQFTMRRWPSRTPFPEPVYYCLTGVEMPLFELYKEMTDQRNVRWLPPSDSMSR